jgi:hypothetical protein
LAFRRNTQSGWQSGGKLCPTTCVTEHRVGATVWQFSAVLMAMPRAAEILSSLAAALNQPIYAIAHC